MAPSLTKEAPLVLVAEDDEQVARSVERALRYEGFRVGHAPNGAAMLRSVTAEPPAVIVLDVMMPEMDGMSACRLLRARGDRTPVLMLTARSDVSDRVAGLEAGADDYLVKPFALEELLARLRALLRRTEPLGDEPLRVGNLVLDPAGRSVRRGEREIILTKTEFDLLELLVLNRGVVLDRSRIYEEIWGYDFETTSNPLEVYVGYLRRKLEEHGEPRLIHTVRGVGYVAREA